MPFVFANLRRFAREIETTTDSGGYTLSQLEFNKRESSSNVSGCRSIVPLSRFGLKNFPGETCGRYTPLDPVTGRGALLPRDHRMRIDRLARNSAFPCSVSAAWIQPKRYHRFHGRRNGLGEEPTVTSVKRKHSISTAPGE